ncbi:MAG: hypothetical protein WC655_09715 [Candidatus Hydrogenedentales bacterium]
MTQTPPPLNLTELVFERKGSTKDNPVLYAIGGVACLVFAVLGFLLAMITSVGQFQLQTMTTLPALIGGAALVTSWRLSRTPTKVVLSSQCLRVETRRAAAEWTWDQIGWCAVSAMTYTHRRQLVVYDTSGKPLVKLGDSLNAFDALVDRVELKVAETNANVSEVLRMRKAKRSAVYITVGATLFLGVVIANVIIAREDQRSAHLLAEAAVPGEGIVEELRIAPNGITRRLIYRVTSPDGKTATRNAQVTPDFWDNQEVGAVVPVIYVPGEPDISRLAEGEVIKKDAADNPMVMYALCAILALMCIFFYVGAFLQWRGWDIDFDSKTHKFSIKRFGSGQ